MSQKLKHSFSGLRHWRTVSCCGGLRLEDITATLLHQPPTATWPVRFSLPKFKQYCDWDNCTVMHFFIFRVQKFCHHLLTLKLFQFNWIPVCCRWANYSSGWSEGGAGESAVQRAQESGCTGLRGCCAVPHMATTQWTTGLYNSIKMKQPPSGQSVISICVLRKCANKNNDMSLQQEGVSARGVSDAGAAASPSTVDERTLTQREMDSTSPDSDITISPKRRRVQTGSM